MLDKEEITKVWESVVPLSVDNVIDMINRGGFKPTKLKSGYLVTFSMDILSNNVTLYHFGILGPKGADPAVCDDIARDILGEEYLFICVSPLSGAMQYIKKVVESK